MPLYVADYLSATEHLDAALSGAYLHLIMHYWQKGCLPHEDKFLARIARMTDRQWAAAKPTIKAFFTDDWKQERVESEIAHAQSKAESRAESGSRGGKAKALKNKSGAVANATVLPEQTPSKMGGESLPSSSGLLVEVACATSPSAVALPKAARGNRLPEGWTPVDQVPPAGLSPDIAARELEKFRDYWHAKAGKDGSKLDWEATWRNWCRNAADRMPTNGKSRNGKGSVVDAGLNLIRRIDDAEQRDAGQTRGWPRHEDVVLLPRIGGDRS